MNVTLTWTKENAARWDADKRSVFGAVPPAAFGLGAVGDDQVLPDEWWRVEDGTETVGYGKLDSVWGDAEILLAVLPARRGTGVGKFVLARLEEEAARKGLNYLYNTVHPSNPEHDRVVQWLRGQGFTDHGAGELRKQVGGPES